LTRETAEKGEEAKDDRRKAEKENSENKKAEEEAEEENRVAAKSAKGKSAAETLTALTKGHKIQGRQRYHWTDRSKEGQRWALSNYNNAKTKDDKKQWINFILLKKTTSEVVNERARKTGWRLIERIWQAARDRNEKTKREAAKAERKRAEEEKEEKAREDKSAAGELESLQGELISEGRRHCKMSEMDKIECSTMHKVKGNEYFKIMQLKLAKEFYKRGIFALGDYDRFMDDELKQEAEKLKIGCRLNLAAVALKEKDFSRAWALCDDVLQDQSSNVKALYRRAQAKLELKAFDSAKTDCRKILTKENGNKEARALFEKATELQETEARKTRNADRAALQLTDEEEQRGRTAEFYETMSMLANAFPNLCSPADLATKMEN
jgi:hypothetical protein